MGIPNEAAEAADQGDSVVVPARSGRLMSLLSLAVFDVGGPLAVYYALRSSGSSTVVALVVSGLLPGVGIGLGLRRHRRVDAVGVVVLFGIVVGVVVGLASGSARFVLLDGTVPAAVLGIVCFGSTLTGRPLMFRMALQFVGVESAQGRDFESKWQYHEFRRIFVVITVVWGAAFVAETVAEIVIIESASADVAKSTSNVMPIVVAAVMVAWTVLYGRLQRARGEREATAEGAAPSDSTIHLTAPHADPVMSDGE